MASPGFLYEKWGSRFKKEEMPRPGGWIAGGNQTRPERRNWFSRGDLNDGARNQFQGARYGGFRGNQPKKRVRFTEWLQVDNARNLEMGQGQVQGRTNAEIAPRRGEGAINPPIREPINSSQGILINTQRVGQGGIKRKQPGDPKQGAEGNKENMECVIPLRGPNQEANRFQDISPSPTN